MSITTVDYEDIGDNYALSQLSRGHCQDALIEFSPLWGGPPLGWQCVTRILRRSLHLTLRVP